MHWVTGPTPTARATRLVLAGQLRGL
jgi:hypothetical protein